MRHLNLLYCKKKKITIFSDAQETKSIFYTFFKWNFIFKFKICKLQPLTTEPWVWGWEPVSFLWDPHLKHFQQGLLADLKPLKRLFLLHHSLTQSLQVSEFRAGHWPGNGRQIRLKQNSLLTSFNDCKYGLNSCFIVFYIVIRSLQKLSSFKTEWFIIIKKVLNVKYLLTSVHPGTCRSRSRSLWGVRNTNSRHKNAPLPRPGCEHWSASTPARDRERLKNMTWTYFIWKGEMICILVNSLQVYFIAKMFKLTGFCTHSLSIFMVEVQDVKRAVLLKRSVQIPELPVHSRNHCGVSQALAENNKSQLRFFLKMMPLLWFSSE